MGSHTRRQQQKQARTARDHAYRYHTNTLYLNKDSLSSAFIWDYLARQPPAKDSRASGSPKRSLVRLALAECQS
jgi:hypothetical protein